MLVAPFTVPMPAVHTRHARRPASATAQPSSRFALSIALGWLAFGGVTLAFLPHSRVGADLGATLPFWLVIAPLVDLAWLMRRRAVRALAHALPRLRRQRRGARRLPASAPRAAASRQLRRSNIA